MAWRIVRQPDGKLARWSDVVESFTHHGMTEPEAIDLCRKEMGRLDAEAKVHAGVQDYRPWTSHASGDGLSRWRDCLLDIALNRPVEKAVAMIREMGFPEWETFVREHARAP
jgi:hypothetical protein